MATYEEPRFTFHKPVSAKYSEGYDLIFGKKCVKRCKLASDKVCLGCGRTLEEIKASGNKKTSTV